MADKEFVKLYCPKSKCYGLASIEESNGKKVITNFYEIDDDTAKQINIPYSGSLPEVSSYLKPCSINNSRTPLSVDKEKGCKVKKGQLWYQCLYCSSLKLAVPESASSSADIYFLMDESGSMSSNDRSEGAKAVRGMVKSLTGSGNTYSFVTWASSAKYLFEKESNISKIDSALGLYEIGMNGVGGSTAAHNAFDYIKEDVKRASKPVIIIFVTDGGFDNESLAVASRDRLLSCNSNVQIFAIGVTGAIESSIRKITTVDKIKPIVGSSSALSSTFDDIVRILRENQFN